MTCWFCLLPCGYCSDVSLSGIFVYFLKFYLFWESTRVWAWRGRQRAWERMNEWMNMNNPSRLCAVSMDPDGGWISRSNRTRRSWPEPKSRARTLGHLGGSVGWAPDFSSGHWFHSSWVWAPKSGSDLSLFQILCLPLSLPFPRLLLCLSQN